MRLLDTESCRLAVKYYMCPVCSHDSNYESDWKILQVNDNLIYCRCHHLFNCNTAYKFKRRKIKNRNDACGWEYIIKINEDLLYGVRGYEIRTETFDNKLQQYNIIMNYFRYGANEIDDLFKEILQDDKEIIHNIVGRDFSDEKYFKEFVEYENWHTNELLDENYGDDHDDDLDDDLLLAELERI